MGGGRKKCSRGHERTGDNVFIAGRGQARCKICRAEGVYNRATAAPSQPRICKRGHSVDGGNVYRSTDKNGIQRTQCKTCAVERMRGYKAGRESMIEQLRRRIPAGQPGSFSWYDWRYDDDKFARTLGEENPDGMTLAAVGACFSLSRERVRQIEERALRILRRKLSLHGSDAEVVEQLRELMGLRGRREAA